MPALLQAYEENELLRLVYFGGVEPSLRKEVWPFLLGHYQFGMSEAERKEVGVCFVFWLKLSSQTVLRYCHNYHCSVRFTLL